MDGGPKGPDGLNKKERAIVRAKLAHPDATGAEIAKFAGLKYKDKRSAKVAVSECLGRPHVQTALAHPPRDPDSAEDVDRNWLRLRAKRIADDRRLPVSERMKAIEFLAKTTPGAIVPAQVDMRGMFTIESFVEAAGGRPGLQAALPPPEEERRN